MAYVRNYFDNPGYYQVSVSVNLSGFGNWQVPRMPQQQPQGYLCYDPHPQCPGQQTYAVMPRVESSSSMYDTLGGSPYSSRTSSYGIQSNSWHYTNPNMASGPNGYFTNAGGDPQTSNKYFQPKTSTSKKNQQGCFSRCTLQ